MNTCEFDPDTLVTAFSVDTNWHVLTGAASCGKTTLIDMLAARGFIAGREAARKYIDQELAAGRTIEEIVANPRTQLRIEQMQVRLEHGLNPDDVVFLDRALPDSITFYRLAGLDPHAVLEKCFRHRYASVFILDLLPFQHDGARVEADVFRGVLDEWLERDYSALGYEVVRVPVLPPEERLAFVLERVTRHGRL
jgi:predicted ATPase